MRHPELVGCCFVFEGTLFAIASFFNSYSSTVLTKHYKNQSIDDLSPRLLLEYEAAEIGCGKLKHYLFFPGEDKVERGVETKGDRGLSPFSKKAAMKSESLSIWEDGGGKGGA